MSFSFRPMPGLSAAALAALAVLIGLGVWQLERREWKLALIAQAEERMSAEPAPLDQALANGSENAEFKHVLVSGAFADVQPVFEYAPQNGEQGYRVIAPLRLDDGEIVLVDREFISSERKNAPRQIGSEHVSFSGWVRLGEKRNWFTPADDLKNRVFYARDPEAMAKAMNAAIVHPIVIVSRETFLQMELSFSNPHLGYALTWFGLAVVLVVIVMLVHRGRGRLKFK